MLQSCCCRADCSVAAWTWNVTREGWNPVPSGCVRWRALQGRSPGAGSTGAEPWSKVGPGIGPFNAGNTQPHSIQQGQEPEGLAELEPAELGQASWYQIFVSGMSLGYLHFIQPRTSTALGTLLLIWTLVATAFLAAPFTTAMCCSSVTVTNRPHRRGLPRPNCHSHWFTSWMLLPFLSDASGKAHIEDGRG